MIKFACFTLFAASLTLACGGSSGDDDGVTDPVGSWALTIIPPASPSCPGFTSPQSDTLVIVDGADGYGATLEDPSDTVDVTFEPPADDGSIIVTLANHHEEVNDSGTFTGDLTISFHLDGDDLTSGAGILELAWTLSDRSTGSCLDVVTVEGGRE